LGGTELQLGLLLGGLEHGVKLGGEHHLALDLDLAGHEGLLAVELSRGEVKEVSIGDDDGDVGLGSGAGGDGASGSLGIERPGLDLAIIALNVKLENSSDLENDNESRIRLPRGRSAQDP